MYPHKSLAVLAIVVGRSDGCNARENLGLIEEIIGFVLQTTKICLGQV